MGTVIVFRWKMAAPCSMLPEVVYRLMEIKIKGEEGEGKEEEWVQSKASQAWMQGQLSSKERGPSEALRDEDKGCVLSLPIQPARISPSLR